MKLFNVTFLFSLILISCNTSKNKKSPFSHITIESVNREIDSFCKIDFLDYNYKYLDKDYNIIISKEEFEFAKKKRNFNNFPIHTYRDSLSVVLSYELNSHHGARIAANSLTFKWKRMEFYLWRDVEEIKRIGYSFNITHPWRFYEFLRDSTNHNKEKMALLNDLKARVENETEKQLEIYPYDKFLNRTFKLNPERIKSMNEYVRQKNSKRKK